MKDTVGCGVWASCTAFMVWEELGSCEVFESTDLEGITIDVASMSYEQTLQPPNVHEFGCKCLMQSA